MSETPPKTIAVGGIQHETNTFAPLLTDYEAFVVADGWPPLVRGEALWREIEGVHLPITGACDYLRSEGAMLKPLLWASATPSGHVTEDAFERLTAMLLEDLQKIRDDIDGVYLDLHGAMVCEHLPDGEGELLRRVRAVIGESMPLAISLDLHANLSPMMLEYCDYIDIFRTYPHEDMAITGERAARALLAMVNGGAKPFKALRQADFVIPLFEGCTDYGASRGLYFEDLPRILLRSGVMVSIACGFPLADTYDMGPGIVAYGASAEQANLAVDDLLSCMRKRFAESHAEYFTPDEAVRVARESVDAGKTPVVIADPQDSPGGGGTGDTTGVLRALLSADLAGSVLACIRDAETAELLHGFRVGDRVDIELGGKRFPGDSSVSANAEILKLTDGNFTCTGPMWLGVHAQLGKMALVRIGNVRVGIQSRDMQAADRSMLVHLGVNAEQENIIVLKDSVHFRADYRAIAARILSAKADGAVLADISGLPFKNLRPSLSIKKLN